MSQVKGNNQSPNKASQNDAIETNVAMEQGPDEDIDGLKTVCTQARDRLGSEQQLRVGATRNIPHTASAGLESDSLNENISPLRPNTKRKRRFKRMALDPETSPSSIPNPVTTKEVVGIPIPTTSKEDFNIDNIGSNKDADIPNLNLGSNNGSKKGTKQNPQQKGQIASNIDSSASNTGTIKRKKVRSRSAGGTNQLPIMQNVKRVYHAAPSHPSLAHCSDTSSKSNKKQHLRSASMVVSQSVSTVVPGKRKRSNNREKSVENDASAHGNLRSLGK